MRGMGRWKKLNSQRQRCKKEMEQNIRKINIRKGTEEPRDRRLLKNIVQPPNNQLDLWSFYLQTINQ